MSLPLRERGLKFFKIYKLFYKKVSLPLRERGLKYAPLAGAWIEIYIIGCPVSLSMSLPLRERGLKFPRFYLQHAVDRRSPCGSVD